MGQEDGDISQKLKSSSSTGVAAENVFCTQLRGECTQLAAAGGKDGLGAVIRGYLSFSGLFFAVLWLEAEKCWLQAGHVRNLPMEELLKDLCTLTNSDLT